MGWRWEKDGVTIPEFLKELLPHVKRFKNPLDWHHAYINLFVEAARISAYHQGHFVGFIILI